MPKITPNLVAFLAYIANQIAGVEKRTRGRYSDGHPLVQGDLSDHGEWNMGIHKALKFMQDRKACPTRSILISAIQKKRPVRSEK